MDVGMPVCWLGFWAVSLFDSETGGRTRLCVCGGRGQLCLPLMANAGRRVWGAIFVNVEQHHTAEAAQPWTGPPGGQRWVGGRGPASTAGPSARGHVSLCRLLGLLEKTPTPLVAENTDVFSWGSGVRKAKVSVTGLWSRSQQGRFFLEVPDPLCLSFSGGARISWRVAPFLPAPASALWSHLHDSDSPWPRAAFPPRAELCFPFHGLLSHISLCLLLVRTCDPTGPILNIQGNLPSPDSQNHLPSPVQGPFRVQGHLLGLVSGATAFLSHRCSRPLHGALTNYSWVPLPHLSLGFANGPFLPSLAS